MGTTLPESERTAIRLGLEIQAELTALESAKERRDWREVCRAADAITHHAAVLDAEQRMDECGIVKKP